MSINKLVSIKNAIIDAMDMLSLDHDSYLPLFMTWATYAEKEIGGSNTITKRAVIEICGCIAELPDDVCDLQGAILGDHGKDCGNLFNKYWTSKDVTQSNYNNLFLIVDIAVESKNDYCSIIPYEVQDNKILLNYKSNYKAMTIQYNGYETDCDGFIMIGQNHVEAITKFIEYKWLIRKLYSGKTRLSGNLMSEAKLEWSRLCAHARALDAELNPSERSEIVDLVNNPLAGRSLRIGMTTNNYNYYGGLDY